MHYNESSPFGECGFMWLEVMYLINRLPLVPYGLLSYHASSSIQSGTAGSHFHNSWVGSLQDVPLTLYSLTGCVGVFFLQCLSLYLEKVHHISSNPCFLFYLLIFIFLIVHFQNALCASCLPPVYPQSSPQIGVLSLEENVIMESDKLILSSKVFFVCQIFSQ